MHDYLQRVWYGEAGGAWLIPLGWLYGFALRLRTWAYASGLRQRAQVEAPVLVVGNVTAGGTGKTPLVLDLAERLLSRGITPGIVSRGYGGSAGDEVIDVSATSAAAVVGDEPALMARRLDVPIAVARRRVLAARRVIARGARVVIADDGLQHLALARDGEVVVLDGLRRLGNGRCLPAGPLREHRRRLATVDAVIVNGGGPNDALTMTARPGPVCRVGASEQRDLATFLGGPVHAIAAIGNPERFFELLRAAGLDVAEHPFPDHARLTADDLTFADDAPVLMTEKDAVKWHEPWPSDTWYVPIDVELNDAAEQAIEQLLDRCVARIRRERHP